MRFFSCQLTLVEIGHVLVPLRSLLVVKRSIVRLFLLLLLLNRNLCFLLCVSITPGALSSRYRFWVVARLVDQSDGLAIFEEVHFELVRVRFAVPLHISTVRKH